MKLYYKISEFADKIGVTATTVRNWDRFNVLKPHHKQNTYRYYSDEQVEFVLSGEFKKTRIHPYAIPKDADSNKGISDSETVDSETVDSETKA